MMLARIGRDWGKRKGNGMGMGPEKNILMQKSSSMFTVTMSCTNYCTMSRQLTLTSVTCSLGRVDSSNTSIIRSSYNLVISSMYNIQGGPTKVRPTYIFDGNI